MPRVVIPDPIWGIPEKYLDEVRQLGGEVYMQRPANQEEAIERIKDAEIITLNYLNGDSALIDASPNLKYIIAPAVGYEWIDTGYAASKGIRVLNCPTFVPLTVAEHALALLFALAKHLPQAKEDMRAGIWQPNEYIGMELAGKTLGLVGYGNIGKNLERMVTALGMTVKHTNSKSSAEEIDELIGSSDIVCLCLPLTTQTRHLMDERRLKLLKRSAFIINVARGAIIDQAALLKCLRQQDFAGAGLDVFEGEPEPHGKIPEEITELTRLPNVAVTPHSAFNTPEALDRKGREIVANIKSCLAGTPQNVVN